MGFCGGGGAHLNEVFTVSKIIGILLIIFGIGVVYWDRSGFKRFRIWQWMVVISSLFLGIGNLFDKYLVSNFSQPVYQCMMFFIPAFLTTLIAPRALSKIGDLFQLKKSNILIVVSAVFYSIYSFMFFWAIKAGGEISRIVPVLQLSTILTVLIGIVFLKERENALRKIIGAIVVVAGVVFIKSM